MTIERKVILLGRHGVAPQKKAPEVGSLDSIEDESIQRMYADSRLNLRPYFTRVETADAYVGPFMPGVQLADVQLVHTPKVRTKVSGMARLAGAFGLEPTPQNADDVLGTKYPGLHSVSTRVESNLDYRTDQMNTAVYARKGPTGGPAANLNHWLQNPTATEHEGVKGIAPFATWIGPRGVLAAQNIVKDAVNGKKAVFAIGHATSIDPVVIALVESSGKKVGSCDDFGGAFDMEDYAMLFVDINHDSGKVLANLSRKGKDYPVDLQRLAERRVEVVPYFK